MSKAGKTERGLPAGQGGFSLLEVMIVVMVILILAAIAAPSLMRSIALYQLESSARQVSNLLLRTRSEAMQRNTRVCTAFINMGGERRYFMDLVSGDPEPCDDAPAGFDPTDPFMTTPITIAWFRNDTSLLPPLTGLPPGYAAGSIAAPANYRITFSPRGTVVLPGGVNVLGQAIWVEAAQSQAICLERRYGNDVYRILITVTPAGKVKLFRWLPNASSWVTT